MQKQLQFEISFPESPANPVLDEVAILPSWSENMRGFPVQMAVSCLFTAARGERKIYTKLTPVYCEANLEVYFKGEELREDVDKAVWLQLMHMARGRTFNEEDQVEVTFTANRFLTDLGWDNCGASYKRLADALDRLQNAQIKVMGKRNGRKTGWITMSYVSNVAVGHIAGKAMNKVGPTTQWTVRMDQFAAHMYQAGMIEIKSDQQYKELRTLSRKILDMVLASTTDLISIHRDDFIKFLGLNPTNIRSAKQNIKVALEELRSPGYINHFAFDAANVLHINRTADAPINRGTPPNIRIHKAPEMENT